MNLNKLKRLFPHASDEFIKSNTSNEDDIDGLHTTKPKQPKRDSLERVAQGKDKIGSRFEITFTIYAVRPNDWDNPHTKNIQDLLVEIGILHGDSWDVLQGRRIPKKARKESEERTEIEIHRL